MEFMKDVEKMTLVSRTKWILVMDDDEVVRTVTRAMLEQAGYKVYLAENGDEAIGCFQEAQNCGYPFDAVIVDLSVPQGKGGKETIRNLLEIDPGVKAIVSSGAVNDPVIIDFKTYGFRGVLKKPFSSDKLEQTVRSVLNEQ
jgi:CheY-like chemotaxis protein